MRITAFLLTKIYGVGSKAPKDSWVKGTHLGSCGASRQLQRCQVYRFHLSHTHPTLHFLEEATEVSSGRNLHKFTPLPGHSIDSVRKVGFKSCHLLAV